MKKILTVTAMLLALNAYADSDYPPIYYPDGTVVQGCPGDPVVYGCRK